MATKTDRKKTKIIPLVKTEERETSVEPKKTTRTKPTREKKGQWIVDERDPETRSLRFVVLSGIQGKRRGGYTQFIICPTVLQILSSNGWLCFLKWFQDVKLIQRHFNTRHFGDEFDLGELGFYTRIWLTKWSNRAFFCMVSGWLAWDELDIKYGVLSSLFQKFCIRAPLQQKLERTMSYDKTLKCRWG